MSKRSNSLPELNKAKHQTIFIHKLYDMLQDTKINNLIWWAESNDSFFILPNEQFSKVLSLYFKHTNIASFIRQLNMYGFHKVNSNNSTNDGGGSGGGSGDVTPKNESGSGPIWEFKHSHNQFRKGDIESLQFIKRRSSKNINKEVVLDDDSMSPMVLNTSNLPPSTPNPSTPYMTTPIDSPGFNPYFHPYPHPAIGHPVVNNPYGYPQSPQGQPPQTGSQSQGQGQSQPSQPGQSGPTGPTGPTGPSGQSGQGSPGTPQVPPHQQYHHHQQYQQFQSQYQTISIDKYLELLNNFNNLKFNLTSLLNKFDYFLNEYKFQQKNIIKLIEILQSNNLNDLNNFKHYLLSNLNNSIISSDSFNKNSDFGLQTNEPPPNWSNHEVQNYTLNPHYKIHEERPNHVQSNSAPANIPQIKREISASPNSIPTQPTGPNTKIQEDPQSPKDPSPPPRTVASSNSIPFHQPFPNQPAIPTSDPNTNLVLPQPFLHKPSRSYSPLSRDDRSNTGVDSPRRSIDEKVSHTPVPVPAPTSTQTAPTTHVPPQPQPPTHTPQSIPPPQSVSSAPPPQPSFVPDENERKRSYQLPSISQLDQSIKMRKLSDSLLDKK